MKEESLFFEESRETLVADAVDEFRARRSNGQTPDPEEFANQHPKIADTLRRILPALQVMDPPDLPETGTLNGSPATTSY